MPGSLFNHCHLNLIPTKNDSNNGLNLEDYPPVGAMFATIDNPSYTFLSGNTAGITPNDNSTLTYGYHYISNRNRVFKVRNYGTFKTDELYTTKNADIDTIHNRIVYTVSNPVTQKIVPHSTNITSSTNINDWINRTFENGMLFDNFRYNFNIDHLIECTNFMQDRESIDMTFYVPETFFGGFLNDLNGVTKAIKDCSYVFINKEQTFQLTTNDQNQYTINTPVERRIN